MQVRLAYQMTRRRVGILTANAQSMTKIVLESAGIDSDLPVVIAGLEDVSAFRDPILKNGATLDRERIENEIVVLVEKLLLTYPDIGAFVFECHNLAPYAKSVQQVTGKPVFDIIDFAKWVYNTINKQAYPIET
jgi:hypothetical protein